MERLNRKQFQEKWTPLFRPEIATGESIIPGEKYALFRPETAWIQDSGCRFRLSVDLFGTPFKRFGEHSKGSIEHRSHQGTEHPVAKFIVNMKPDQGRTLAVGF